MRPLSFVDGDPDCDHERWVLVEDYAATTGRLVNRHDDDGIVVNSDPRWDEVYESRGVWLECAECEKREPFDPETPIEWV